MSNNTRFYHVTLTKEPRGLTYDGKSHGQNLQDAILSLRCKIPLMTPEGQEFWLARLLGEYVSPPRVSAHVYSPTCIRPRVSAHVHPFTAHRRQKIIALALFALCLCSFGLFRVTI
jgi:hypothetical protein